MTAEEIIAVIEDECCSYTNEILDKLCKRAMRKMNSKLGFLIQDDYPNTFRFIDFLACEIQSKNFDEIFFPGRPLEDYIDEVLDEEYDNLQPIERSILSYSNLTPEHGTEYEFCNIRDFLFPHFEDMLNEHWVNSKKIQNFENNRTW